MKAASSLISALLIAALPTSLFGGEIFPVDNADTIRVRVLDGRSGKIVPHAHIVLLGGYDQGEVHRQIFREERLTNDRGEMKLSRQLENLPWLQVWVDGSSLCQQRPEKASFSVELIRRDGVSAPNRCGTAVAEEEPGLFTVFVKNPEMGTKGGTALVSYSEQPPAPAKPVYPFADYKAKALADLHAESTLPEAPIPVESVAAMPVVPSTPLWFAVQSIPGFTMAAPKQSHKLAHHAAPAICQVAPAPVAGKNALPGKPGAPAPVAAKPNAAPAKGMPVAPPQNGKKDATPKLERVSSEKPAKTSASDAPKAAEKTPAKRQPSAAELARLKPSMRIRPREAKAAAAPEKAAKPEAKSEPKDAAKPGAEKSPEAAKAPAKVEEKKPTDSKAKPEAAKKAETAKKAPEAAKAPAKVEEKKPAENKPKPEAGKKAETAKKAPEAAKAPAKAEEKKPAENKPKPEAGKKAETTKKTPEAAKAPAKAEEKKP